MPPAVPVFCLFSEFSDPSRATQSPRDPPQPRGRRRVFDTDDAELRSKMCSLNLSDELGPVHSALTSSGLSC